MRVLVTGGNGFVGGFAIAALQARGDDVIAAGHGDPTMIPLDLSDALNVRAVVELAGADAVIHLAAQAFVPESLANPIKTFDVNAMGTVRLLDAIRKVRDAGGTNPRVLIASTAEVYGMQPREAFPIKETASLWPSNPYAASKISAEAFALATKHSYGLDIIVARAFNHIGPGQDERFVVASFAGQLARISRGAPPEMLVGDLSAERDFLDVRDVVRAYLSLIDHGTCGEIYNVSSGSAVTIRDVLRTLVIASRVAVEIREDPERLRSSDIPLLLGDATKLHAATGWTPQISLSESLRDTYRAAYAQTR